MITNLNPPKKKSDPFSTRSISKASHSKTHNQNSAKVYQKAHNRTLEEAKTNNTAKAEVPVSDNSTPKNAIATSINQKETVTIAKDKIDSKVTETIPNRKESTPSAIASELEQLLKIKVWQFYL